jgi:hypothetical protein
VAEEAAPAETPAAAETPVEAAESSTTDTPPAEEKTEA